MKRQNIVNIIVCALIGLAMVNFIVSPIKEPEVLNQVAINVSKVFLMIIGGALGSLIEVKK